MPQTVELESEPAGRDRHPYARRKATAGLEELHEERGDTPKPTSWRRVGGASGDCASIGGAVPSASASWVRVSTSWGTLLPSRTGQYAYRSPTGSSRVRGPPFRAEREAAGVAGADRGRHRHAELRGVTVLEHDGRTGVLRRTGTVGVLRPTSYVAVTRSSNERSRPPDVLRHRRRASRQRPAASRSVPTRSTRGCGTSRRRGWARGRLVALPPARACPWNSCDWSAPTTVVRDGGAGGGRLASRRSWSPRYASGVTVGDGCALTAEWRLPRGADRGQRPWHCMEQIAQPSTFGK